MSLLPACACLLALAPQSGEVPPDRYMSITIGISATLQLAPFTGNIKGKIDPTMSDVDDKQLAAEGFRCIRYILSPVELTGGSAGDPFKPDRVQTLLNDIQTAQMSGLSVIVAPKLQVADLASASEFLGRLAGALAKTELESTFLEVCADPLGMEPIAWDAVQSSWISAIRQNMPRHTLIVRAAGKDGPADLTSMMPLQDRNLVYAFQFGEPAAFLTQCLPGSPIQEDDRVTLPYPATVANVVEMLAGLSDEQKDWAMKYAHEEWNAVKISDLIHPVGDWSRSKKVRVICDSFGVSQKVRLSDRQTYLQDVNKALTDAGLGWTLSEYVGPRGVFTGQPGLRVPDPGLLGSIGLNG